MTARESVADDVAAVDLSALPADGLPGTDAPHATGAVRILELTLYVVVGCALIANVAVVFGGLVSRAFGHSLLWQDEVTRLGLTTMAYLGGAVAYVRGAHPHIELLGERLPVRLRAYQPAVVDWIVVGVAAWLTVASVHLISRSWAGASPVLGISPGWFIVPMPVGMASIIAFAVPRTLVRDRGRALVAAAVVLLPCLVIAATHDSWVSSMQGDSGIWIMLAVSAVVLVLGVPIAFVFAIAALFYAYGAGMIDIGQIPISMSAGVSNFVLVAIPFFVFAGLIMDRGGVTRRLVRFLRAPLGQLRGGLYYAEIVGMFVFSGISGSKSADVAAIGSALTESLRDEGYDADESVALLASSAAMGETIPPSVAMLVLGSVSTTSVAALFLAGILPAALMAVGLLAVVAVRVRTSTLQARPRTSLGELTTSAALAVPALLMLVILFGGILAGVGTPTEISSVAVVYGLLLAVVFYRELGWRSLGDVIVQTVSLTGMILLVVATANALAAMLTLNAIPDRIGDLMSGLGGGATVFMLATIVVLFVFGMLFEGLPALIIFAPLLFPIVPGFGIDPLTYGIVMIIAMGIGGFSPPAGVGFYIACQVGRADPKAAARHMLPYVAVLFVGAVLTAFVPFLTQWLPTLIHTAKSVGS
jgi:tripartite ATP-independent transporter DctM subunit